MARIKITIVSRDDLETENVAEASAHEEVAKSASVHEGSRSEPNNGGGGDDGGLEEALDAAAAAEDDVWTYCFGASTVTISHIREMVVLNYFAEGDGRAPEEETIPEPGDDEAVVFEEFFTVGLRMPPHSHR
jgi:hypothetical protein